MNYEELFKPFCIDFFSKENEETRKSKIAFAFDNKDEAFNIFRELYHTDYGSIDIDENLVSIHTGGWSENEEIIYEFKKTEWWRQNLRLSIVGGHYYFDTNRREGVKEWKVVKQLESQPDEWVSVDIPPKEDVRVEIFSPCYPKGNDMRNRIIDSQFLSTCIDATHYRYLSEPLPQPPKQL